MILKKPLLSPDKAGSGTSPKLAFVELVWQRPYQQSSIESILAQIANTSQRGPIIFEARMIDGRLRYFLGVTNQNMYKIKRLFNTFGKNVHFYDSIPERKPVTTGQSLKVLNSNLSLNIDYAQDVMRAGIAAMSSVGRDETAVVQLILGPSFAPASVNRKATDPNASWLDVVLGNANQAAPETLKSMRSKAEQFSFSACVRIGASGDYAYPNIVAITSALSTLASAGVRVHGVRCNPEDINNVAVPSFLPWRMPLRLGIKEIVPLLMLPFGEEEIIGAPIHPKQLLPPYWYKSPVYNIDKARIFAESLDGKQLNISDKDSRYHTAILGPTGSGKSTVMLNLIMQDIKAGRSVLVIDPKADLAHDVLARVPDDRLDDVVVIDPSDPTPTGFNPLKTHRGQSPSLVTDAIMSVLQNIFQDVWGIRAQDVLNASILTLTQTPGANLMWLPALLTNTTFRKKIVSKLPNDIALKPFWKQYDEMKDSERRTMIESSLNKIRQLLYRPGLRAILGQSNPSFNLMDLYTKRKIVLVPLNKGLVGSDTAKLLGSMIVGLTWTLALSRARIPPEKRHTVCMFVDELQDYLSFFTSFSDALAQARGLGLSITVAHQYRAQLTPDIRQGIDANCRNKIIYGLNNPDAREMSMQASELSEEDFMTLPKYHIYTNYLAGGRSTGWIYGKTAPPSEPIRLPAEGKAHANAKYGRPAEEIDAELTSILVEDTADKQAEEEAVKTTPLQLGKRRAEE